MRLRSRWVLNRLNGSVWLRLESFREVALIPGAVDEWSAAHMEHYFDYTTLVRRLVDLERLMLRPRPGERTALASSYDRASRYDGTADRYIDWGANDDGTGVVRMEGDDAVLAEIEGPGCIWRIWAATVGPGHVRIYLDGATEPAIDLPFAGYFDRLHEPFTRSNVVYKTTAEGYNNYTPIPFQRSCRIVAAKEWGKYYHFNYTQFPKDTRVETFQRVLSKEASAALDAVNAAWGRTGELPNAVVPGQQTERITVTAWARQQTLVTELRGPRLIRALRLRFELPANVEEQRRRLRELAIRIVWDDEPEPAVWSPLGDFFGSSAGAVPFRTLPLGLKEEGTWYCYWPMPFATRASVQIDNDSDEPVEMWWEIEHAPVAHPPADCLRFHAKWHRDVFPVRPDREPDWTLLQTNGAGRFVGTQLHVWNPRGGWWGEGDEKFFVDGEAFPSVFGTGTEDYLGYAWSSGGTFVQALHSQPVNQNNRGHVSANRWHIPDDVPFQQRFEATIEKYFPNSNPCHWAAVAFWYLEAGGHDPFGPIDVRARIGPWTWPAIYQEPGVIEAEAMPVLKEQWKFAGCAMDAVARNIGPGVLSGDRFLIWWVDRAGYRLELGGVRVERAGRYRVLARLIRDRGMGRCQFELTGRKLGAPVDLYDSTTNDVPRVGDAEELGVLELSAGEHVLAWESLEKNPQSTGYLVAVDYFKLVLVS